MPELGDGLHSDIGLTRAGFKALDPKCTCAHPIIYGGFFARLRIKLSKRSSENLDIRPICFIK